MFILLLIPDFNQDLLRSVGFKVYGFVRRRDVKFSFGGFCEGPSCGGCWLNLGCNAVLQWIWFDSKGLFWLAASLQGVDGSWIILCWQTIHTPIEKLKTLVLVNRIPVILFDMRLCGLKRVVNACCSFCRELMVRDPISCWRLIHSPNYKPAWYSQMSIVYGVRLLEVFRVRSIVLFFFDILPVRVDSHGLTVSFMVFVVDSHGLTVSFMVFVC